MSRGSNSFPPEELETIAIYYSQKAMAAEVANARSSIDMQVLVQKLNAATAQIATLTKERDAALAERDAARAELAAPKVAESSLPVIDPPTPLLPAGGVDEEPAPLVPAGPGWTARSS